LNSVGMIIVKGNHSTSKRSEGEEREQERGQAHLPDPELIAIERNIEIDGFPATFNVPD